MEQRNSRDRHPSLPAPHNLFELEKKVKATQLHRFLTAALALLIGALLAGAVHAQGATRPSEGPLGQRHAASGVKCAACHGQTKKPVAVTQETCLSCHGDSRALAAKTANVQPTNPHESRHYGTEAECGLCHRQHSQSVNFCLDCHPRFDFKVK